MKINHHRKNKKILPISIIAALLIAGGVFAWYQFQPAPTNDSAAGTASDVNYDPPTDQEIKEGQDAKKAGQQGDTSGDTKTASGKTKVDVGISYADVQGSDLVVRAFTSSVIEGTGTCTVTATKDGQQVTEKSKAFIDASSTICTPVHIATSRLSSGTWSVTVHFSSPDHEGTSDTVEVRVS